VGGTMKVSDGRDAVEVEQSKDRSKLLVSMRSTQIDTSAFDAIGNYVTFSDQVPEGFEKTLVYDIPVASSSLSQMVSGLGSGSDAEIRRFELAQRLSSLKNIVSGIRIPFIHPDNIFVSGSQVQVLHYGLENVLTPKEFDGALFLRQYKALVLCILNPRLSYESLIDGSIALHDRVSQTILECSDVDDVIEFIDREAERLLREIGQKAVHVPKGRYRTFKIGTIVFFVIALVLGWFTFSAYGKQLPQANAIMAAQSDFVTKNYAKTLSDLNNYSPQSLPKSAKYILAVSAVNLTDLNADQKQTILNGLSTKTDDNTLDYWIDMGRGDFNGALNLAQNLGDDQMTLLAYMDLYQVTKLNTTMAGSKKQQLLDSYNKSIQDLTKKLQGTSGSGSSDSDSTSTDGNE
jgi:type VII secretion protein EssB